MLQRGCDEDLKRIARAYVNALPVLRIMPPGWAELQVQDARWDDGDDKINLTRSMELSSSCFMPIPKLSCSMAMT